MSNITDRRTARRLLRTINEAKRPAAPPLNVEKWRTQLRAIRNELIKLRDKAEDELDRVEAQLYDSDALSQADERKLEKLAERLESGVDYVADAINQIDLCL